MNRKFIYYGLFNITRKDTVFLQGIIFVLMIFIKEWRVYSLHSKNSQTLFFWDSF